MSIGCNCMTSWKWRGQSVVGLRNVPLLSTGFLQVPYNSLKPVGLLRVTVSLTINEGCYVRKLGKACVRTEKPGGRCVLMSWKQQLHLVTTGSSSSSSEPLAARSLV
ncbi:unnamed protein product [Schistosoma intercalatum]|nr:unnamed protein product [Schistosoma intercalatum]